jgi:hypothetical protein
VITLSDRRRPETDSMHGALLEIHKNNRRNFHIMFGGQGHRKSMSASTVKLPWFGTCSFLLQNLMASCHLVVL